MLKKVLWRSNVEPNNNPVGEIDHGFHLWYVLFDLFILNP